MKHWTKKEKDFLKSAIEGGAQHLDVAQALGRTETAITQNLNLCLVGTTTKTAS